MTLKKAPNVREIRGRFENWNNDCGHYKDVIIPLGKPPTLYGDTQQPRDRSFSVFSKTGGDFAPNLVRNNSLHQGKPGRKTQFAEKQKLAESIVANIKYSNNELHHGNSYRTVLNSLFDKELKTRPKRHRMAKNNEERQFTENVLENEYDKNQKRVAENGSCKEIRYNNCKDIQTNNNLHLNSVDNSQTIADYDSVTSKYINNLNLDRASVNQKLVVKHQLNSFGISPTPLKRVYDSIHEPLRPPRRRVIRKKSIAPSPPTVVGGSSPQSSSCRQVPFVGPDQFSASSYHNLSTIESTSMINPESMNVRRNSAGDLYPFVDTTETFPNYRRDPFSDFTFYGTCPEDLYSLPRCVPHVHGTAQDNMPCGPPPRKPPRTFAHDIYRQAKQTNMTKSKKDLETMYAKPLKKTKRDVHKITNVDKTVSFTDFTSQCKPPIAPKPQIANNYKRYSVIEPIESTDRSDTDVAAPIKRNTSFRFSFRKPRSSSPMASKQIARLKDAVRNFQFKKDVDGRVAKLSKSAEHLSSKSLHQEDHIYATPQYNSTPPIENEQELHYMCSPLFPMENAEKQGALEDDDIGSRKAKLDWGGLKKEFRQSCRMVQKRIKGAVK